MNPRLIFEFSDDGDLLAVIFQAEDSKQQEMLNEKMKKLNTRENDGERETEGST